MFQPLLVSVCIANYNGMAVIDDCIRSVIVQSGEVNIEILVHDDASSDGSPAHIREQYPHVKLIESSENVGFCVANNRMAAAAKGQYILLLNNDAVLYPDALETLHLEARQLNTPAILSLPQYDARSGELIDRGCLLDPFFNPVPNLDPQRRDVAMVIGACLWVPRVMWHELGGLPEWFESIAEDMYLCCRARLAGYAVRALTTSGYRHWQGGSFGGNRVTNNQLVSTFRRRALSERNKSFVMVLTCPAPFFQVIVPIHLMLLLLEGIFLTLLRRDMRIFKDVYLPALAEMVNRRQFLLGVRSSIQKKRTIRWQNFFATFTFKPQKASLLLKHGVPHIR
jgi:GT2 family glycosyltransferase|nr:glycosyltransferase family 2 protein [Rhodoferax sp.]